MNEELFFENHRNDWGRLMQLCDKADRSPTDLSSAELRELIRHYRRVSTDLALVRTVSTNPGLVAYLNDLAARAYSVVYREPRQSIFKVLAGAVATAAQTVRRRRWFLLVSFLVFFGAAFVSYGLCLHSVDVRDYFVPSGMKGVFDEWKTGVLPDRTASQSAMMGGFYASNNPRTAVIAGAVGAGSFGIFSVYLLAQNGALMGVLASELAPLHKVDFLVSSVAPHGVPELSGIIIAGASGFLLGFSLIAPGRRSRGDSLRAVGRDAVTLLATSVIMMFIAAPIEGFFSFNPHIPGWLKTSVALVSIVVWAIFWTSYGKTDEERAKA